VTFLCGPASIIFALIQNNPVRYVQICQSLFETGSFGPPLTKAKTFTASDSLRAQAPADNVPAIDWMLAATLREAENQLFPVSLKLGQLTLFDGMKLWATELLSYTQVEATTCYFYGEMDAVQKAQQAVSRGGMAFLLIDSVLLGQGVVVHVPTHWIAVMEPMLITPKAPAHIHFYCFTWSDRRVVDMDQAAFNQCLYGVVTAQ
jgi:hypothetical protein